MNNIYYITTQIINNKYAYKVYKVGQELAVFGAFNTKSCLRYIEDKNGLLLKGVK